MMPRRTRHNPTPKNRTKLGRPRGSETSEAVDGSRKTSIHLDDNLAKLTTKHAKRLGVKVPEVLREGVRNLDNRFEFEVIKTMFSEQLSSLESKLLKAVAEKEADTKFLNDHLAKQAQAYTAMFAADAFATAILENTRCGFLLAPSHEAIAVVERNEFSPSWETFLNQTRRLMTPSHPVFVYSCNMLAQWLHELDSFSKEPFMEEVIRSSTMHLVRASAIYNVIHLLHHPGPDGQPIYTRVASFKPA
jgi:hypothetical protein